MADVSQWDANELKNIRLDELNLSDERGKRTAKLMSAVKKKFDSVDAQLAAAGPYTYKGTVEDVADLESVVSPAVGDAYAVASLSGETYAYDGESWASIGLSDSELVHRSGDETLEGVKVFSNSHATAPSNPNSQSSSILIKSPDIIRGTVPEYQRFVSLSMVDSTGTDVGQTGRLGSCEYQAPVQSENNGYGVYIRSWKYLPADDPNPSTGTALFVGYDKDEIPYSTAPATSDERTNSTDIVTRGYMEASNWNWQKTNKKVLVQFKPVPESDLEPVVDFAFTETPPASGEKGSENPSTIAGVDSAVLTRCGKNLCPIDKFSTESATGLTINANTSDGYISVSGTASSSAAIYLRTKTGKNDILVSNSISRGKTYTFSLSGDAPSGVALKLYVKSTAASAWVVRATVTNGNSQTYTIPAAAYSAMLRIDIASGTTLDCKCYAQVEEGSIATSFEPYEGNDYTISLGSTYYGGSIDVSTGAMTVTHVAVAPAGETVDISSAPAALPLEYADTYGRNISSADGSALSVGSSGGTVVYRLASPQTVQLTPAQIKSFPVIDKYEPRINTVYSDQEAVQVGYQRFYDENRLASIEARLTALEED